MSLEPPVGKRPIDHAMRTDRMLKPHPRALHSRSPLARMPPPREVVGLERHALALACAARKDHGCGWRRRRRRSTPASRVGDMGRRPNVDDARHRLWMQHHCGGIVLRVATPPPAAERRNVAGGVPRGWPRPGCDGAESVPHRVGAQPPGPERVVGILAAHIVSVRTSPHERRPYRVGHA